MKGIIPINAPWLVLACYEYHPRLRLIGSAAGRESRASCGRLARYFIGTATATARLVRSLARSLRHVRFKAHIQPAPPSTHPTGGTRAREEVGRPPPCKTATSPRPPSRRTFDVFLLRSRRSAQTRHDPDGVRWFRSSSSSSTLLIVEKSPSSSSSSSRVPRQLPFTQKHPVDSHRSGVDPRFEHVHELRASR